VAKHNKLTIALEKINRHKAKLTNHHYFEPAALSGGQPLYLKSKLKMFQKTGDFFGELSLMGKPYRHLNAMAKEHSVLLELNPSLSIQNP
jgi:CRP-like cAMP-binding protein